MIEFYMMFTKQSIIIRKTPDESEENEVHWADLDVKKNQWYKFTMEEVR